MEPDFSMQYQYREKGLCPAAVHADNLAGQIGALVAQMVNEVGNLLGLAQPSGRNFFYQVDQLVLLQPLIHFRVNGSRPLH